MPNRPRHVEYLLIAALAVCTACQIGLTIYGLLSV